MRHARLPAERRIKGQRRIVVLIVICDLCGNREVGWGWHDARGQLRFENEIEPPADLGNPGPELEAADWSELKRREGRLMGPRTERNIVAFHDDDKQVFALCPRHGAVRTREPIDPATVPMDATRRVRAYKSGTG